MTLDDPVVSITIHNERMYMLIWGQPMTICVSDLSGEIINSWTHSDSVHYFNKLTIVGDELVVPDRTHKQLTVYSVKGWKVKDIPCSKLSKHNVSLCRVDGDSVIVCDYGSSSVFRVNITSGNVLWTTNSVSIPEGITMYGDRTAVVLNARTKSLAFLNTSTGK